MLTIAHIWKCDLCGNVKMVENPSRTDDMPRGWSAISFHHDPTVAVMRHVCPDHKITISPQETP